MKHTITHEEVQLHDKEHNPGGDASFSLYEVEGFVWELMEIPLDSITSFEGLSPSEALYTEGYLKPTEDYDHIKMQAIYNNKSKNKEENKYFEYWADEWYARMYASETTQAPAIVVFNLNGYKIRSGRHRARAAYLRGENSILAYVGVKKD